MLLCCFWGCGFSAPLTTTATTTDVVLAELQGGIIEGQAFDITKYEKNKNGTPEFLMLAEREYNSVDNSAYFLEIYVFNPTGKALDEENNIMQMSSNDSYYFKYDLIIDSVSQGAYANMFYKFHLKEVSMVSNIMGVDARVYDVSGIQLSIDGVVKDYAVNKTYTYIGEADTLKSTVDILETISLDVETFTYRYFNGTTTNSVLHTALFGVDEKYFGDDIYLSKIHAEWIKAHTSPVIVINDDDVYSELFDYVGIDLSTLPESSHPGYCLYQPFMESSFVYNWAYNVGGTPTIVNKMDKLTYVFKTEEDDYFIPDDEIISYSIWYTENFGSSTKVAGKYSSDLFATVDDVTDTVISSDDKFTIDGFSSGSAFGDWWYSLVYPDLEKSAIANIEPIYCVQESDMSGNDTVVAGKLLLSEKEVPALRELYEKNKVDGKRTYLFRFAVGDYTAVDVNTLSDALLALPDSECTDKIDMDVYLNFDIIDLTFDNNGLETTIPVVSDPQDSIPDVEPPVEDLEDKIQDEIEDKWWLEYIGWGLVVVVFIVGVLLLGFVKPLVSVIAKFVEIILYVIKVVVKAVVWIIFAPFKFVAWLFRKIFRRG